MLEKENLTPFQIQLLLYYLTAEPSKRTVTDSARSLNVSKWVVTRTLDTLEKLNIVERLENRKTVLTVPGVKLAEKYQKQRKVLEKYMQYQDIPPAQIKENALRALAARFSDEFMDRLAEQESRMHIKEIFAGQEITIPASVSFPEKTFNPELTSFTSRLRCANDVKTVLITQINKKINRFFIAFQI